MRILAVLIFQFRLLSCLFLLTEPPIFQRAWVRPPLKDEENYRLPITLAPVHYVITLVPHIFPDNFTFNGQVDISGVALRNTRNIVLHYSDMLLISTEVHVMSPNRSIPIQSTSYNCTTHLYTIRLKKPLSLGSMCSIRIKYVGNLRDDMFGFYRSWYITAENKTRWLAFTQLQATNARRVFPCFDEPALKATFQINIARTPDMHSISNMPLDKSLRGTLEDIPGKVWDQFAITPRMSTYLVAFAVTDFQGMASKNGKYISWSQDQMVHQAELSLEVSPPVMRVLERYTQIDYSLPKLDQIAVPDFSSGAMENWGLVTYREQMLLFENGVTGSKEMQATVLTIAHELAHMWFGNLVTPNWWNHVWLSEGFATYFSYFAVKQAKASWRLEEQFVVDKCQRAMVIDSLIVSSPLSNDVYTPLQVKEIFNIISYDKAACIIRQMKHFLTPRIFRKGIRMYLKSRMYMTTEPDILFDAMNEAQKEEYALSPDFDVKTIMNNWVYQSGYPVIHLQRTKHCIKIIQEKFYQFSSVKDNTTWWVPITYTTSQKLNFNDTRPKAWLKSDGELRLPNRISKNDWIILNIRSTGYYRVSYDNLTWTLLTRYLSSCDFERIPPVNRAQLIDDALKLAHAGLLEYSTALDLSSYLVRERDYIPWKSFFNNLPHIYNLLYRTEANEPFKNFVLELLETLIWRTISGTAMGHVDNLLLEQVMHWACKFEHPYCMAKVFTEFERWTCDPINYRITQYMKPTVFCIGLKYGGVKEFDLMWKHYLRTVVATEKALALKALSCGNSTMFLKQFMKMEGITVRKQDWLVAVRDSWNDASKVAEAINFLRENFDELIEFTSNMGHIFGIMYDVIMQQITKPEEILQLEEILEQNVSKLSDSQIYSARVILILARKKLEWHAKQTQKIQQWFTTRHGIKK